MIPRPFMAMTLAALASGGAIAQTPTKPFQLPPLDGEGLLAGLTPEVHFDERGPAELWALGNTYKMGFDAEGATYYPFFGSRAPRNYPVRFRVGAVRSDSGTHAFDGAALPTRQGQRVLFERGPFTEVYDLDLESAEQSFHFATRPGAGGLLIELEVESELTRSTDADGLVLSGEHGRVHYSSAIAIDARGTRVAAPTRWHEGRVEIELAAAELDRLQFPLVVDPVITTFSLTPPTVMAGHNPDVVYDEETGWWCVAFEREFSAGDTDVFSLRMDENGVVQWDSVIDTSNVVWTSPKIANNRWASDILIVATAGSVGSRQIRGRIQDVLIPSTTGVILVSPAGSDATTPDVGGDASDNGGTYYCVVWQRVNSMNDSDIRGQMIRLNGTHFGSQLQIAGPIGTVESYPTISHNNGDAPNSEREWTIAWHRFALSNSDLYAARVSWDGVIQGTGAFPLDTTISETRFPSVSSPTRDSARTVAIVYMRGDWGSTRTYSYVLQNSNVVGGGNINALTGAPTTESHLFPSIDCDGSSFVVVESQSIPNSIVYGVYASTLDWLDGHWIASEAHVSMGVSGAPAPLPEVACAGASGGEGDVAKRACIVWHYEGFGPDPTLFGSLYEAAPFASFCEPEVGNVMDCPCGNAPSEDGRGCDNSGLTGGARLSVAGNVDPDSVTLTATDMLPSSICLLAQATGMQPPAVFGDGLRCAFGTVKRMGIQVASSGQATWPGPGQSSITGISAGVGDPLAPGDTRYYFVYYRDPAPGWACVATFNLTQTVRVRW